MDFKTFSQAQLLATAAVIILVAGGLGFWLGRASAPASMLQEQGAVFNQPATQPPPVTSTSAGGTPPPSQGTMPALGENRVAVHDQAAGMSVVVASVTLTQDGWVAIHEDANGKPGRITGAQRFNAGRYENVMVDLLVPTDGGETYYAMLHIDDGDRQFDLKKDLALMGGDNTPVMTSFAVLVGAR